MNKIILLEPEATYDVEMADPNHNLVLENSNVVVCNSHAISYSLTAYQTMFLRKYHPLEFWAASLNSVEGKSEDITQFISSMKKDNIKLIIPSYKDISSKCYVKDGAVVIGTNIIKGMSSRISVS